MTSTSAPIVSLPFIRTELNQFQAYTPHPGGAAGELTIPIDRLDTNENPYDLPSELKQELAQIWEQEIESNRYPDGAHTSLKRAIASYVSESAAGNPPIAPSQISVGNGSDELIRSILIATCIGGEGSILVAQPTFSMYGILAQTLGIPVVSVDRSPLTWEIDLAAARQAMHNTQNPPIRVVFVVHPNSPTANALTAAEIEWLRQLPSDLLVVIDEAYFEFSQHTLVTELSHHPNWIVLRTFSKAFRLAAHRVGYAIAHPDVVSILERVRLPYNLPSLTLAAAQLALKHHSSLLAVIPEILDSRDRLYNSLSNRSHLQVWRSDANFLYARLQPQGTTDPNAAMADLVTQLKRQGTLIRHTGGGLRITIGSPAENQRTLDRLISVRSFSDTHS